MTVARHTPSPWGILAAADANASATHQVPGRGHAIVDDGEAIMGADQINPILGSADAHRLSQAGWSAA